MWPFRRAAPPAPSVTDLLLAQREIAELRAENMRLLVANRELESQCYDLQRRLHPFVKVRKRDARGLFLK
jgi:hypothetical protein